MFFNRRGGVELISIIILSVILGAAAIGIGIGLSKNAKNTAEGGLSANNSHLSALYQSLEDELDYNPGESGVPGSPINIAHAHTGAEGDGPRINYFDLLNIPSKFTPENHDHNSLYYGKSEIDTKLNNKANASHNHNSLYYAKSEIDTQLSNKANASHNHNDLYYSKEEIDAQLDDKASVNIDHAHTGAEGDGPRINYFDLLNIPLKFTPESHDHNSLYYGKSEIDTKLNNKANASHNHNSLYYAKSEIDTKLSNKANVSHNHNSLYYGKSEIDTKLNNKANASHNHNDLYYSKEETYNRSEIDSKISVVEGGSDEGKRTARFTIGTTQAGWTTADCDYLCDGTNDQEEINAAITALPATGGEIVILDGTYNITAKINVTKDNVSIRGNGNATILKRMYNSSVKEGVITLTSRSGCKIANLQMEGNKTSYIHNNNYGIYLSSSSDNTVTGNTCNNNYGSGIYLSESSNNTVTYNTCNNNNYGIRLSSSNNNTVTGNTCNNGSSSSHGIYLSESSNNTVTGNTCNNNNRGFYLSSSSNNTITGNTCNNNSSYGIYLYSSSDNTVTGNTCNNNSNGIYLYSSSDNNAITGNICNNNNNYGICLSSSCNYNCIVGNVLVGNGTAYYASGGTGNVEANNVKKDSSTGSGIV